MISIKTPEEIQMMREGGKKLARIMEALKKQVEPGKSTAELDAFAEYEITKAGAKPAFKNYQKFPNTLCTSVNEELVHVIPSMEKILKEGDIITLDLGLIWKGFYVDMARTVAVGKIDDEKTHLIRATRKALRLGITKTRPGNTTGDIGNTIQRFIESQGYNVVRDLCGHGIGRELHEEPPVLNYGKRKDGPELKEGMVICIEPMVTQGDWQLKHSSDKYGYTTKDDKLSAHFEDTIAITKEGVEVLTTLS
ncbi:type I methionyl aminopeptidase [Patescibacteria group bacterium]|nr:type I methionyl aminopeptidase [Patescibacteria group bacterium]